MYPEALLYKSAALDYQFLVCFCLPWLGCLCLVTVPWKHSLFPEEFAFAVFAQLKLNPF